MCVCVCGRTCAFALFKLIIILFARRLAVSSSLFLYSNLSLPFLWPRRLQRSHAVSALGAMAVLHCRSRDRVLYIYTYKVFFSFSKSFRKRYGKRLLCSAGCVLGSVIYLFFFFVLLGHGIAAHKVRDKMISCGLSYYYGNGRTGPFSFFRGTPSEICEKPNLQGE